MYMSRCIYIYIYVCVHLLPFTSGQSSRPAEVIDYTVLLYYTILYYNLL